MRISHLLVYVFLLVGLLLLGGMLWQVGMTDLLTSFGVVGWWIVPWVLLEIVPVVLHTAGWGRRLPQESPGRVVLASLHRTSGWQCDQPGYANGNDRWGGRQGPPLRIDAAEGTGHCRSHY